MHNEMVRQLSRDMLRSTTQVGEAEPGEGEQGHVSSARPETTCTPKSKSSDERQGGFRERYGGGFRLVSRSAESKAEPAGNVDTDVSAAGDKAAARYR